MCTSRQKHQNLPTVPHFENPVVPSTTRKGGGKVGLNPTHSTCLGSLDPLHPLNVHSIGDHLRRSERKESSTAGSASMRSPSSMPSPSRARGSILRGSSRAKGSISKPGTWDRALAISLERPVGESPGGKRRRRVEDSEHVISHGTKTINPDSK